MSKKQRKSRRSHRSCPYCDYAGPEPLLRARHNGRHVRICPACHGIRQRKGTA